MKHTIKTASGQITIEAAGKPGIEFVLVTLKPPFLPSFDIQLTPEQSGLLAMAFDLAAEECRDLLLTPGEKHWPVPKAAGQGVRL